MTQPTASGPDHFDPATFTVVEPRAFEDLRVGDIFRAPGRTLTDAHATAFQAVSADNHPIHYNVEYARSHGHTAPVVHGAAHSTGIGPAPLAITAPASHLFPHEGTQHVYYIGADHHVTELWWWPGGDPHHEDLTVNSGDTSLPSEYWRPTSHVLGDTQHVFYTSSDAEMIELWWQP
jgi:hypothetical protein